MELISKKKSIRKNLVFIVTVAFLAMAVLLACMFFFSMRKLLKEKENNDILSKSVLSLNVLESSVNYLPRITRDWSSWDNTYMYVKGEYDGFMEDYLTDYPFQLFRLNILTIINDKNEVVYERFYDFKKNEFIKDHPDLSLLYNRLNPVVMATFDENKALDLTDSMQIGKAGFVSFNGVVYYISAFPVLFSDETGPCAGTFLFGRIINGQELDDLTRASGLSIGIMPVEDYSVSEEIRGRIIKEKSVVSIKDENIVAYSSLADIFGENELLLRIQEKRTIYQEGISFILLILFVVLAGCVVTMLLQLLLIKKVVVQPISALVRDVDGINAETANAPIPLSTANKELYNLSKAINGMLMRLDKAQATIEDSNKILYFQANHDQLTGLYNRIYASKSLDDEILKAKSKSGNLLVYYFDIDHFKFINDVQGSGEGDKLIQMLSKRLNTMLPRDAVAIRMGGDEFVVLMHCENARDKEQEYAAIIFSLFSAPYYLSNIKTQISASIGSSYFPKDGNTAEALLKNSEIALFYAKSLGFGQYVPYYGELRRTIHKKLDMTNRLKQSMAEDFKEFDVWFQPVVDAEAGKIVGAEALLRWKSANKYITPGDFLPLAEDTGLIIPLSWWMMQNAFETYNRLLEGGLDIVISVNASAQVIMHEDFVQTLKEVAREYFMPLNRLTIEIVEATVIRDIDRVNEIIKDLHELGTELSVDDFGTGYSSLSYLHKLLVDRIKIDQSFISRLPDSGEDKAIVSAITAIAKALNIKLTVEGVETKEQLMCILSLGCTEVQGYYFSKPLPPDDFIKKALNWEL